MPEAVATEESFAAIIVAAGAGARFGRPKHDLVLAGKPLWRWSADVFEEAGASEVVVVGDVPGGVPGGVRRRDSVRAGIESLILGSPFVLIHDAARPFAGLDIIEAVVTALVESEVQGAIPAIPVTDTIKRCEDGRIVETVDRSDLVAVQTPQGFRTEALLEAHRSFPTDNATDDAALVEANGGTVVVVKGDRANLKITFPFDLAIAEAIVAGGER
jgi:2-C-methyl-D-erythritol 4-phosphate cytidylyltransferase/2-C-methyl-D-erythritol 2,4-cyclodiphosphate synthase